MDAAVQAALKNSFTEELALGIANLPRSALPLLVANSHGVTQAFHGTSVELCAILSAKTGRCSEDCSFCSQSAHFETPVAFQPMLAPEEIVSEARKAKAAGAVEFCIVTSGRGPSKEVMAGACEAARRIGSEVGLRVVCSLGILTTEQAEALAEAGVWAYNHNLESTRERYSQICTTHTFDERIDTCRRVKAAGMDLCAGGILGLGEAWEERIQLAFELKALSPRTIPLNFINPRPGTPLEEQNLVAPWDAVKAVVLFRFIVPEARIMIAGGREVTLRDLQPLALLAGANAMIIGNYLTTEGQPPSRDLALLADLELPQSP